MVELDARAAELLKQASDAAGVPQEIRVDPKTQRLKFPVGMADVIMPDGTHRYWSTHCRHDRHEDCSASSMLRDVASDGRFPTVPVSVTREPAQCKTCQAPCICDCHKAKGGVVDPAPWLVIGESGPEVDRG